MASSATLWRAAPRARTLLGITVALGLLAAGLWYAFLIGLAVVVAAVFIEGAAFGSVAQLLVLLGGLIGLRAVLSGVAEVVGQSAASEVKSRLRSDLSTALLASVPGVGGGRRSGELVHLVTEEVERLDEYVARYLPARSMAVLAPGLVLLAVALIDPLTLPILLFAGPLLVIVLALIGRTTQVRTQRRERELAWMDGHFLDMLRGLPTLRLFGRAHEQVQTIDRVAHRLASSSLDVLRTAFQTSLVLEWGATAATALVAIAVSVRLMAGDVSFERAMAVLLLTPEFFGPIRALAVGYHAGTAGTEALRGIDSVLGEGAAAPLGRSTGGSAPASTRPSGPAIGDIAFRSVRVRYEDRERPALDALSIELASGHLIALTGPTGSGKSTVAMLLLRFLDPDDGAVTVGGVDLGEIDPIAWRRSIAWVAQRPHLFDGTIADNLRLGRTTATDADLRAAAGAAGAAGFIDVLPGGYDTRVGEGGARFSGGQRQRLAIARALVRDAPLLILDEPTSHLDDDAAEIVRATLLRLRGTQTLLVITHDAALVSAADEVIELDEGRPVRRERPAMAPVAAAG